MAALHPDNDIYIYIYKILDKNFLLISVLIEKLYI